MDKRFHHEPGAAAGSLGVTSLVPRTLIGWSCGQEQRLAISQTNALGEQASEAGDTEFIIGALL